MVQITQFLRRAVQTRPDGVASECEGRIRTWREFEARVAALTGAMAGLGYRPGDRIGMLALNCDRYLEYFFAMAWGGFVFVPINTRLAPPEVAFWLEDSGCSALFVDDAFLPMLSEVRAELRHVIRVGNGLAPAGLLAYEDLIAKSASIPDAGKRGDDLAGIFYTGGTTGRSKGVMLSHRNIAANAMLCAAAFGLGADVVYLHAGPMFHLADGASTFLVTAMGGKHVFMPRFEPGAFLEAVARFRVTATLLAHDDQHGRQSPHGGGDRHVLARLRALWRFADARGGHSPRFQGDAAYRIPAGLWPIRGRALHDVPAAGRACDQGSEGGSSEIRRPHRARLRSPRLRRERQRGSTRRRRRDLRPWRQRHARLLAAARDDREYLAQRLATHRRRRLHGRGRILVRRRPHEGHDHLGRREHLFLGSRAGAVPASRHSRMRRHRRARRALGRAGSRRGAAEGGEFADGGDDHRALPDADRPLQMPARGRVPRGAAASVGGGKDPEDGAAQAVLGRQGEGGQLKAPAR